VLAYDKRSPPPGAEWIDYGLLALTPQALAGDEPDLADVSHRLAAAGELAGMPVRARFYEIGTPESLAEADRFLSRPRR
jgi:NDP-sugar pyrophosphorylase family protein